MSQNNLPPITFVSIADAKYFGPLTISIHQALKLYSEAKFYVYDWGLTETQARTLRDISPRVFILPWTLQLIDIHTSRNRLFVFCKALALLRDSLLTIPFKSTSYERILSTQLFEIKIFNKFLCIEHFNATYKENFIFLDADAFLINSIGELFDGSFDLGVTVRRKSEWSFAYNHCTILNVGVMLFLGGNEKNTAVIDGWRAELKTTQEVNCEQTALTRFLHKHKPDMFENTQTPQPIHINGREVRVRVLPCELYNYNWIEEFASAKNRDQIKILHFKSGRFTTPLFKTIAKNLNIDI